MGKSLYVKRMTQSLREKFKMPVAYPPCITIPIHVPTIDFDEAMESLLCFANPIDPFPQIFHFDISPSVRNLTACGLFINTHSFRYWKMWMLYCSAS